MDSSTHPLDKLNEVSLLSLAFLIMYITVVMLRETIFQVSSCEYLVLDLCYHYCCLCYHFFTLWIFFFYHGSLLLVKDRAHKILIFQLGFLSNSFPSPEIYKSRGYHISSTSKQQLRTVEVFNGIHSQHDSFNHYWDGNNRKKNVSP